MTWDLRLNPATRDLELGVVSGPDEVLQRLITRLKRELGEWFLNTKAGLPWYQNGRGILGSKASSKRAVDLLIRRETLGTQGVERIIKLNTLFAAGSPSSGSPSGASPSGGGRTYSIYMEVFITGVGVVPVNFEGEV